MSKERKQAESPDSELKIPLGDNDCVNPESSDPNSNNSCQEKNQSSVFRYNSLGAKFIIVVVAILSAAMSGAAYVNYQSQKQQLLEQLITQGKMLGNFVALVSPEAVLGYDFVLMDEYMKEISDREDIVYSIVFSPDNTIITNYINREDIYIKDYINEKKIATIIEKVRVLPNMVELKFPITSDGENLGEVRIGISTARITTISEKLLILSLVLTCIIIFVLSIAIYLVFKYNALNPIKDLIHSSNEIASGNLEHNAQVKSTDELGRLAVAFNNMTASLKTSYDHLHETNEELVAATKAKSAFLANMSHEIRTPLTAIVGFGESLLDSCASEAERMSSINTIIRNGNHLQKIINDILDLSKIEADKLDVELIDTSPLEVLKDIEDLVSLQAKGKNLSFEVKINFPLPANITTDPLRLKQILINLCGNALKFTERGKVYIEVSCDVENQLMDFDIVDTGIGLQQDQIENIFKPFSQADASTTRQYGGTGLGLPLSKNLVEMLGGSIKVESNIGIGSRFTVTIATGALDGQQLLTQLPDVGTPHEQNSYMISPRDLQGEILLAEDTIDNQRLIRMYISKTRANLTIVENGRQAIETAMNQKYDLILMDMQMPVLGGAEAVTALRARNYDGPIVALTANSLRSDRARYQEIGCDGFVAKPIDREILLTTLKQYLPHVKVGDTAEQPHESISKIKLSDSQSNNVPDPIDSKLAGEILLAEDTVDNQRLVRMYIRKAGPNLTIVENGKEAVEAVLSSNFDLILMDMQMPVMGGVEAIEIIKKRGCTTPIVALTANALKHDRDNYEKIGCAGFVAKPINRKIFIETLAEFLPRVPADKKSVEVTDKINTNSTNVAVEKTIATNTPFSIIGLSQGASVNSEQVVDGHDLINAINQLTQMLGKINLVDLQSRLDVGVTTGVADNHESYPIVTSSYDESPINSTMVGDDPEYDEVIGRFITELNLIKMTLTEAHHASDWPGLKSIFTFLKENCRSFGFEQIGIIAEKVEISLAEKDHGAVAAAIAEYQSIVARIPCQTESEQYQPIYSDLVKDDPEMLEAVNEFIDGTLQTRKLVNEAFENKNWDEYKRIIHNIKGSGGAFGFPQLTNIAREIHALILKQQYGEITSLMDELNVLYDRILTGREEEPPMSVGQN